MARREPRLAVGFACSLGLHLAVPVVALLAGQLVSGFHSRHSRTATRLPEARVALDLKPTGGLADRTTRTDGIPGVPMRISLVELPASAMVHFAPTPTPAHAPRPKVAVDAVKPVAAAKPPLRRRENPSPQNPQQRLSQVHLRRAPERDGILVAIASPPPLEALKPASAQLPREDAAVTPSRELHAGEADPSPASVATAAESHDVQVALPPGSGAGHDRGQGGISGRDPNEMLVAERVAHVATLFVGAGAIRQHGRREAHLRFRIDSNGYVQDFELKQATHVHVFDDSIEVILHLAEPFPVAERAYEINLPFAVE